jgi:hypothetical protein
MAAWELIRDAMQAAQSQTQRPIVRSAAAAMLMLLALALVVVVAVQYAAAHSNPDLAPNPLVAPEPTPTPTPMPSVTPTPPPHGQIINCPLPGKWALAYYNGPGASLDEIQDTCPFPIEAAYRISPDFQLWSRYFRQQPEISNLGPLWNLQGLLVLGSTSLHAAASDQTTPQQLGQMHDCPRPNRWAISVWTGDAAAAIEQALATCPTEVAAAYWIDPYSQTWSRYFAGRPDISDLKTAAGRAFLTLGSGP